MCMYIYIIIYNIYMYVYVDWGEWPSVLRHCEQIPRFPVQTLLGVWRGLGTQLSCLELRICSDLWVNN